MINFVADGSSEFRHRLELAGNVDRQFTHWNPMSEIFTFKEIKTKRENRKHSTKPKWFIGEFCEKQSFTDVKKCR